MSAPERCRACSHAIAWRSPDGREHVECLRAMPMVETCGWHHRKTEYITVTRA